MNNIFFLTLFKIFSLLFCDLYIKKGENLFQNGTFEYPFHDFEEIIANPSINDYTFIFLSSQNCSSQIAFSKNSSIIGDSLQTINFTISASIIIEVDLTLISLSLEINSTNSCYNQSLFFVNPSARLNIINCNLTMIFATQCLDFLFFISNFANLTLQNIVIHDIISVKKMILIKSQIYSYLKVNFCVLQDINVSNIRFMGADNSFILINSTSFKNIYSEKNISLTSSNQAFLELYNSKLLFSFCNILQSSFNYVSFINMVQVGYTLDLNYLTIIHEFQIINCLFSNIIFLSIIPFIQINSISGTNNIFQFINFMNFSTNGIIFGLYFGDLFSFKNLTFFATSAMRNFYVLNSYSFSLINCTLYTNNLNFISSTKLESTALFFWNVKEKILDSILMVNYSSYITTPGIKIISSSSEPSLTIIKNSLFSNIRMIYAVDYESGAVLYVASNYEDLTINNSIFESNLVVPTQITDRVGSACARNFGADLKLKIFDSFFKNNQAAFGCNCIEFDGVYLEINNSIFSNNTNLLPPKHKDIMESIGYGGSIYFIGNNLTINFSQFIDNMNYFGGNIYIDGNMKREGLYIQIDQSSFINNYAHSFGAAFYFADKIVRMNFYLLRSLLFRNWGNYNAAIFMNFDSTEGKTFFFYDKFIESWSDFSGAIDFESQSGISYIKHCDFFNNTASWYPRDPNKYLYDDGPDLGCGGAIGLNAKSGKSQMFVFMENNNFTSNIATMKGSAFITIGGNVTIINSIFAHNTAGVVGTFYIHINSFFAVENSTIIDNIAYDQSSISLREFSYLIITSCIFKNIKALSGKGMIYADSLSAVIISNSTFEKISAAVGSILYIYFNGDYTVKLVNNIFINNFETSPSEGMFYVDNSTNIILEENYFANNSNRLIYVKSSKVLFKNNLISNLSCEYDVQIGCAFFLSQFSFFKFDNSRALMIHSKIDNSFFYCMNSDLYIQNSTINDMDSLINRSFIGTCMFSQIFILNSSLVNFSPGGIKAINSTQFFIGTSNFKKKFSNIFEQSPSLYIEYSDKIAIEFSNFMNNFVPQDGGAVKIICDKYLSQYISPLILHTNFFNNSVMSNGGAISTQGCDMEINSSFFSNNNAKSMGGALFFDNDSSILLFNNTLEFNEAYIGGGIKFSNIPPVLKNNFFGQNQASYGNDIASYAVRFNIQQYLKNSHLNEIVLRGRPSQIAPLFQNFSLEFIDINNQTVSSLNEKYISLSLVDLDNNNTLTLYGETKILIKNGSFTISNVYFASNLTKDSNAFLITSSEISQYKSFNSFALSLNEIFIGDTYYLKIPLNITECEIGEVFIANLLSCVKCSNGKYSLKPNATVCESCPPEASYCNGKDIYLKTGYWRSDVNSTTIYPCEPVYESCLGAYNSTCSIEYRGVLCQSCNVGEKIYSKSFGSTCVQCSDNYATIIVRLLTGSIFLLIFYIIIIYSNLKLIDSLEINVKTGEISQSCKENFYSPIYNKILMNYFQIVSLVKTIDLKWGSFISDILQIQYVAGNAPTYLYNFDCLISKDSPIPSLYYKVIMTAITPVIGLIFIFVYWKIKGKTKNIDISNQLTTSELVLLNILQPTVVNMMMTILSCKNINGIDYIISDLYYECYDRQNVFYILIFALPSLMVWILIYPIRNLYRLRKQRNQLNQLETRRKLGFLYNSYRIKLYYWDTIEIYKKYLVIFIVNFLQMNTSSKSLLILLILFISAYFLSTRNPYLTKDVNKAAFLADLVALSTLFFGLLAYAAEDNFFLNLSEIMIILNNIIFLGYFITRILIIYKNKLKKAIQKYPFLTKIFFRMFEKMKSRKTMLLDDQKPKTSRMINTKVINVDLKN